MLTFKEDKRKYVKYSKAAEEIQGLNIDGTP